MFEGIALLGDTSSVPTLREMLLKENDLSWKLTISGALWRLIKDQSFVENLEAMKASENATLKQAHFEQVLWLSDERSISFLVDFLDDSDSFVRYLALSRLNELEFGRWFPVSEQELPHQSDFYRTQRADESFVRAMVENLKRNRRLTN